MSLFQRIIAEIHIIESSCDIIVIQFIAIVTVLWNPQIVALGKGASFLISAVILRRSNLLGQMFTEYLGSRSQYAYPKLNYLIV